MIISYSYLPVVEEVLIERLIQYFKTIQWNDLYPNFPLRINNEFPWVPYMANKELFTDNWLDLNKVSGTLFPSITVVTTQDSKSPTLFLDLTQETLLKAELADFIILANSSGSIISPAAVQAVTDYFATNDILYGAKITYQRKETVNIDITVDDETNIKNRLYDLLTMFLVGRGALDLQTDLKIEINKESITGNRSGAYNIDFGRTLKGSTLQFSVDYGISQVYYDTAAVAIASVDITHNVGV